MLLQDSALLLSAFGVQSSIDKYFAYQAKLRWITPSYSWGQLLLKVATCRSSNNFQVWAALYHTRYRPTCSNKPAVWCKQRAAYRFWINNKYIYWCMLFEWLSSVNFLTRKKKGFDCCLRLVEEKDYDTSKLCHVKPKSKVFYALPESIGMQDKTYVSGHMPATTDIALLVLICMYGMYLPYNSPWKPSADNQTLIAHRKGESKRVNSWMS